MALVMRRGGRVRGKKDIRGGRRGLGKRGRKGEERGREGEGEGKEGQKGEVKGKRRRR